MKQNAWNKCDICGRFIAFDDFKVGGGATTQMIYPDSHVSTETWETICASCNNKTKINKNKNGVNYHGV